MATKGDDAMNAVHAVRMAGKALLVVASIQAYAQTSDVAPAGNATSPGATTQHTEDSAANYSLGRRVRAALSKAMGISASHIIVRSTYGAVTLQGAVPQWADGEKAEGIAKGVPGVVSVRNEMSIRPEGA
jgi:osmotically-inducible protein OsmY